jgi:hypothetical protein
VNTLKNITIILFILVTWVARAQEVKFNHEGLVLNNMQDYQKKLSYKSDSITSLAYLNRLNDSIKVITWADSMRYKIDAKYDMQVAKIKRKMDSLRGFSLPTSQLQNRFDRIQKKQTAMLSEVKEKQTALQTKVTKHYSVWESSVRNILKLDSFGIKMPDTKLPDLPNVQVPVTNLKVPGTKQNLPKNSHLPGIPPMPTLGQQDFSSLKMSKELKKIGGSLSLPNTSQLKQWEGQVPALKELNNLKVAGSSYKNILKDPTVATEKAIMNLSETSLVKKELGAAGGIKTNETVQIAGSMKDTESMKSEGIKLATNHFEGKEKELSQAMDQMAKYKKKYESLPNLADAKRQFWKPKNGLKGKPFRERFALGFNTGFRTSKDTLILDFYPTASYKISGRIEAGVGGIYHVRALTNTWSLDPNASSSWGGSAFVVVKTFKNVFMRLEADASTYSKTSGDGSFHQAWRWTYLSGLQTHFPISRRWTGNIQTLYNFDHKLKDGFPERLVVRMFVQVRLFSN